MPIRYFVSDVDRSIEFYASLGFSLRERWGPPFAIVEKEGDQVWLSGPQTSAAKPMPDGRVPAPGGWNRIVVVQTDLLAMYERMKESGTIFRNIPLTGPGGTQVIVDDPDGNPIELFEPRVG